MNKYDIELLNKSGLPITVLDTVDSTNNFVKSRLLEDMADGLRKTPFAVLADTQSAGRGRYERSFFSPEGAGIYLSYAYRHEYSEPELLEVTTKVAEFILPVLQSHSSEELWIKPINDIYKGDRKILGILVERVDNPYSRGDYALVIGIGINCFSGLCSDIPDDISDKIGFLEPDCSRSELSLELLEVLHKHFDE